MDQIHFVCNIRNWYLILEAIVQLFIVWTQHDPLQIQTKYEQNIHQKQIPHVDNNKTN